MTLQWSPPVTPNGIITQYSLQFDATIINITNNMLTSTVERLSPDTVYRLELRAHTGAGAGPASVITVITRKLSG